MVVIAFAVLDYLVLPQIAGTKKAFHLLGNIRPWWAISAVTLEALSLVSYSLLTRTVFPTDRPPFAWLIRTDITALGVSHLLPGGAATSSALRYRLLRQGGVPAEDTAVGMAVEGVGSNLVLALVTWAALVVSIPLVGFHSLYVISAIVGAVIIAAAVLTVFVRSRQPVPERRVMLRAIQRLPSKIRPRMERALRESSKQLHRLLSDKPTLRVSAAWAAGSWLLDAASLWVFLAAYGHQIDPDVLLVAYGIANLVAIVPISPGGLGVIEAVLIPSLVGFGTPRAIAVLGVVSWRLFNFWGPIPAAGISYLSLRAHNWQTRRDVGTKPTQSQQD
jgi:uncharacterized protein (TIRG00374 family)